MTPAAAQNRSEDEYTRYELLAQESASFKIVYDVTAVTPGATFFFNPIRKGKTGDEEMRRAIFVCLLISWPPVPKQRPNKGEPVLKGTKPGLVKKVQPVSIHGQISLDVYFVNPDEPDGQVSLARVGPEATPRNLEAGDLVVLHYLLGVVTRIEKSGKGAAGVD